MGFHDQIRNFIWIKPHDFHFLTANRTEHLEPFHDIYMIIYNDHRYGHAWSRVIIYIYICIYMILYDHTCVRVDHIWQVKMTKHIAWSQMIIYDHMRSHLTICGHIWPYVPTCDQKWTYVIIYDHICNNISFCVIISRDLNIPMSTCLEEHAACLL